MSDRIGKLFKNILMVLGFLVLFFAVGKEIDAFLFSQFGWGGDSTDSPTERSLLGLRTDYGTGCQYLVSPWGGITPRLTLDGSQVCEAIE